MKAHFVAVSGTGMGSLAGLFQEAGHEVRGSDVAFDPPMGPALREWGVACDTGFDPAHLAYGPDLVVIGNVCRKDNPLARAAIDGGLRYTDMAHALGEHVLSGRSSLVVAGTHGKTTTSAMCAHLLEAAGLAPGFLIGGLPKNFPRSFRLGETQRNLAHRRRPPFVVEGDEYDTAFFEKTPKCWHYRPEVAIVTSIEHDHVDIYPDERSYLAAFEGFVERLPKDGLLVAAAADAHVRAIAKRAPCEVAWFSLDGDDTGEVTPEWSAAIATEDHRGISFDVFGGGVFAGRFGLGVPGRHNVRNVLAAVVAAVHGYGAELSKVQRATTTFGGVRRRQDLLGEPAGVIVYDDFAHHPTAVDETLRALAGKHPGARLCAVFEPRSATACRAMHQAAYAGAFGSAEKVLIAPMGRAKLSGDALDVDVLAADLRARGKDASAPADHDALLSEVLSWAKPGDVVALLSNGAFGGFAGRLLSGLENRLGEKSASCRV